MKDLVLRSSSNPLITVLDLPYQANAVFNAGAADLGDEILLLLRVESCSGRSHLIAARSRDGVSEWRVEETALLHPAQGFPYEANGVEDCRITWMEDLDAWGIAYTAYSPYGPGVAIATTSDFRTAKRIGMVMPPEDKNAALFPCKFNGLHAMFHRPSVGGGAVWISYSPDLVFWGKAEMVIPVRGGPWWDATRVGGGMAGDLPRSQGGRWRTDLSSRSRAARFGGTTPPDRPDAALVDEPSGDLRKNG
jgi:predicted GH43/DUF377 family glycosyl hydrolase